MQSILKTEVAGCACNSEISLSVFESKSELKKKVFNWTLKWTTRSLKQAFPPLFLVGANSINPQPQFYDCKLLQWVAETRSQCAYEKKLAGPPSYIFGLYCLSSQLTEKQQNNIIVSRRLLDILCDAEKRKEKGILNAGFHICFHFRMEIWVF